MLCYNITECCDAAEFGAARLTDAHGCFIPRKTSNRRNDAALELKVQVRTLINADDDTVVSVSERDCGDPGCAGTRTIVLMMHPGRATETVKIDKPLEQVTQSDLADALAPLVAQTGLSELSPKPK